MLEIIHADEITHVTAGHRWFTWICEQQGDGIDPVQAFREEVRKGWRGDVKGPFNVDDRAKAGLSQDFYQDLRGEMGFEERKTDEASIIKAGGLETLEDLRTAVVQIEYDGRKQT